MLPDLSPEAIADLLANLHLMPVAEKEALLKELDALDAHKTDEACRTDFLTFCKTLYPSWKEGPHHRHMAPLLTSVAHGAEKRLTVSMPPRFGKALEVSTEIPTPDRGFVRLDSLRPGDFVFAADGTPTRVVAVSPVWKNRPVHRVTTNDGFSVIADEEHEWDVVVCRKRAKWSTVDTKYVLHKTAGTKESRALRIPLQAAAQYQEVPLLIHPYVLGVWLGDGRTNGAAICTSDDFIFDKVNLLEPGDLTEYATKGITRHWRPGPLGKRGDKLCFAARLRALSVTDNKHIPDTYMLASAQQRLHLLQGLIDTDGTVGKKGCVSFYNTNERLARQVHELVHSLGVKASLASGPAMLNGVQFGTCWKVHFFMVGAASLPRKAERCRRAERTEERYIRAEPAGVADTVCIQVEHPRHLFLCTRGYIPTHNSETIAYMFVAWYLGHHPEHHIIMVTHTAALSSTYGRKIRNLIDSPQYQKIFPGTKVSKDKSASDDWTTTAGGKYFAIGIGANVAGHGAHLLIADDLVSEQALTSNPDLVFAAAWQYMQVGPLQRLMPEGRIAMIGTRWGKRDPIGRALQWARDNPNSPQWNEVRFPAILPSGKSLWPEQWPLDQLESKKASMFPQFWAAQYMQEPTSEEGAIIKREWWKAWAEEDPPICEYIIMALDAAAESHNKADFTAIAVFGVFKHEKFTQNASHIVLLNAINRRVEFPELKDLALREYKAWRPDAFIVEKKSSGTPLFQELRKMGIPVSEFTPHRGTGDKYARINAVADLFRSGMVWYPAGRRWAEELIDQVAEFPNGEHDDLVDVTSMVLSRFRNGGFIRIETDEKDEETLNTRRRAAYY